jgi:hypothetical protein
VISAPEKSLVKSAQKSKLTFGAIGDFLSDALKMFFLAPLSGRGM